MIRALWGRVAASRRAPFLAIALVALVFLLPVLANPGFYNHDEWQKADHVTRYGLLDYMRSYVRLPQTSEFGVPVRPLSFAVQGLVAPFMQGAPFIVHLADVLMHIVVACLLFVAVRRCTANGSLALAAGLLFTLSPLAVPSVIWSAALMDRLYVLWGLAAFLATERYLLRDGRALWLVGAALACALAILSKETAAVLPGVLVLWAAMRPALLRQRRWWLALAAWTLPVALFIAYRLPALLGSAAKARDAAYSMSLANVPDGLALYFAFPFLPGLTDAANWVLVARAPVQMAIGLHLAFVAVLGVARGWRIALLYLAAYLLFLAPVLVIPSHAAHYLYGSAIAMAIAMALVLATPGGAVRRIVVGAALLVATLHALAIERFGYSLGTCMARAAETTQVAYLAAGKPAAIRFLPQPGAATHVLYRLFTGREQLGEHHPIRFMIDPPAPDASPVTQMTFDQDCVVRLAPSSAK